MKQFLKLGAVLAATAAAVGVAPAAIAQAQPTTAVVRHLDGTVASVGSKAKAFRMLTENGRRIRLVVNRSTRFERVDGFAGLAKGQVIEVSAERRNGRWVALEVERRRDDDRRGGDDDDHDKEHGGDDHGGRGGDDDGPNHD